MAEDKKTDAPSGGAPQASKEPTTAQKIQSVEEKKQARRAAKEQQRLNLWRSRVHLIKDARDRFSVKDFSGAVVSYEKYFRVLEIIYEAKQNEIKVELFNNSARAKELVVIASAYWDMVRIYDQSPKFNQRLNQCADKLAEFLPYTPIYMELIKKIEDFKKVAKNKDVFEQILKKARKKKRRCFIATAAFDDVEHPTILILTQYRDQILLNSLTGKRFIDLYYKFSPPIAGVIERSLFLKHTTQKTLNILAQKISQKYNLK